MKLSCTASGDYFVVINYVFYSSSSFYKTTNFYSPEHERSIAWNDPEIGVEWPKTDKVLLSAKDEVGVLLKDAEL